MIGFMLLIVPGLILLTIWSVAAPVIVLSARRWALRRSRELVRGNGWPVFGVILILLVLVGAARRRGRRIGRHGHWDHRPRHRRRAQRPALRARRRRSLCRAWLARRASGHAVPG